MTIDTTEDQPWSIWSDWLVIIDTNEDSPRFIWSGWPVTIDTTEDPPRSVWSSWLLTIETIEDPSGSVWSGWLVTIDTTMDPPGFTRFRDNWHDLDVNNEPLVREQTLPFIRVIYVFIKMWPRLHALEPRTQSVTPRHVWTVRGMARISYTCPLVVSHCVFIAGCSGRPLY